MRQGRKSAGAGDIPVFDSHSHFLDRRIPLAANDWLPPRRLHLQGLPKAHGKFPAGRGAVVSGSLQAQDQSYLVDALSILGTQ